MERADYQHHHHTAQNPALLGWLCHLDGRSLHLLPAAIWQARGWQEKRLSVQVLQELQREPLRVQLEAATVTEANGIG